MTSLGHAPGHVTNTEKMQRLPGKLLYRDFFHWFNILNLILITLCIDFVLFLQGQILREFQNIEKFVIFCKKDNFEKGMHSYVYKVGFTWNLSKKAGFNEKPHFLYHLKKPDVRPIFFGSYPISACAIYTNSALRYDQTKWHGVSFSLSSALFFYFSLILSLLVLLYFACTCETQRKNI